MAGAQATQSNFSFIKNQKLSSCMYGSLILFFLFATSHWDLNKVINFNEPAFYFTSVLPKLTKKFRNYLQNSSNSSNTD